MNKFMTALMSYASIYLTSWFKIADWFCYITKETLSSQNFAELIKKREKDQTHR